MPGIVFEKTGIDGLMLVKNFYSNDPRGYFQKDYESNVYARNGVSASVSESFYTRSKANVVRGLHFQTVRPQAKLVKAVYGKIFDVAVDLRNGSPTFGKWQGFDLSEDSQTSLYIPEGFAHGFLTVTDAIVSYKCIGEYLGQYDTGIVWDDPDINIEWPLREEQKVIISEKDGGLMSFKYFKEKYVGL